MEPPLFPRLACDEEACAASAAVARPANVPKQNVSPADDKNEADQQYPSDRALLLSLPVEILHAIISLISLTERPTLLQLSHTFTSVVTHPAFLLSRRASGASDEILFLVGGTYPLRLGGGGHDLRNDNDQNGDHQETINTPLMRVRRMGQRDNFSRGLWGYIPSLKSWRMFGGDPRRDLNHPMEHVVDSKPLYLPAPHHYLLLFGGFHNLIGDEVDRVTAYSILKGRWETWPSMLRARRGKDLHAVYANGKIILIGCSQAKCGCRSCGNGSVFDDQLDPFGGAAPLQQHPHSIPPCPLPRKARDFGEESSQPDPSFDRGFSSNKALPFGRKKDVFDGSAEVFDLGKRKWTMAASRAPSCPPRDGGAAFLEGRYVYLPGVDDSSDKLDVSTTSSTASSFVSLSDDSGSDTDDQDGTALDSPIPSSPIPSSPVSRIPRSTGSRSSYGCARTHLFSSRRPGLIYDICEDSWTVLVNDRSPMSRFPTIFSHQDKIIVMGGYRSGRCGDSIMSFFRDGLIVDYEEHLDYVSSFSMSEGKWRRHLSSNERAKATTAGACEESLPDENLSLPTRIPAAVRGASAFIYNGRLTLLGGMTTFSQAFHSEERRVIWQYHGEEEGGEGTSSKTGPLERPGPTPTPMPDSPPKVEAMSNKGWKPLMFEWEYGRPKQVKLPVSALLDSYAFSCHL